MPKGKEQFLRREISSSSSAPSLGLLIQHLRECMEGYFVALEAFQLHSKKLEGGGKLSSDEMRHVWLQDKHFIYRHSPLQSPSTSFPTTLLLPSLTLPHPSPFFSCSKMWQTVRSSFLPSSSPWQRRDCSSSFPTEKQKCNSMPVSTPFTVQCFNTLSGKKNLFHYVLGTCNQWTMLHIVTHYTALYDIGLTVLDCTK